MKSSNTPLAPEIKGIAETLLEQAFRGPVRLGEAKDLGGSNRSKVYRSPAEAPRLRRSHGWRNARRMIEMLAEALAS